MAQAVKNIIAFNKLRGTERPDVLSESDLPRIQLLPIGIISDLNATSNSATLEHTWRVIVDTGDWRYTKHLAPIVFAVFAACELALSGEEDGNLLGLCWKGEKFTDVIVFSNAQLGASDPQTNQGITGLSALCDLTVRMHFTKFNLRLFNAGDWEI